MNIYYELRLRFTLLLIIVHMSVENDSAGDCQSLEQDLIKILAHNMVFVVLSDSLSSLISNLSLSHIS